MDIFCDQLKLFHTHDAVKLIITIWYEQNVRLERNNSLVLVVIAIANSPQK